MWESRHDYSNAFLEAGTIQLHPPLFLFLFFRNALHMLLTFLMLKTPARLYGPYLDSAPTIALNSIPSADLF